MICNVDHSLACFVQMPLFTFINQQTFSLRSGQQL